MDNRKQEISYKDLEEFSWNTVRDLNVSDLPSPQSVHIPINLPESKQLIFCDKAFNVYTLPIPEGMNSGSEESWGIRETLRIMLGSFAFGEPAFVPDFQLSKATRKPGAPGEIVITYFAWELLYQVEYCVDGNSNIRVRVTVKNTGQKNKSGHVRVRLSHPREKAVFLYHYVPFAWDAGNWIDDDSVFFRPNSLYTENGRCGKVFPNDFALEYETSKSFAPEEYNSPREFCCESPYWVHRNFQLRRVQNTLHFSVELAPAESKCFELAFASEPGASIEGDYGFAARENRKIWDQYTQNLTELDFGDSRENDIFQAVRNCTLQLLVNRGHMLQPCQGGSSERFFVWVWEAMQAMKPMLKLGCGEQVRNVLEFFLSLQDSGTPPRGEFSTVSGAIGTTGPRWANSTGSALLLVSEYLLLSNDRDFLDRHIDGLLRAVRWILGEVKETRKNGAVNFGLMPKACATDGDYGYIYVFTDSFSCAGVEKFCEVLRQYEHEDYPYIASEAALYRRDLNAAIKRVSRPDGFINRTLSEEGNIFYGFRNTCGAMSLVESGFSSALEPHIAKFIDYSEKNNFHGFFCAPMTYDLHYIGNVEKLMAEAYIRRKEYKKAWTAIQTFRTYGMTSDLYLTQERYCESNPALTCWQPNGSNNGRYLDLAFEILYYPCGDCIYLLGGIAPFEFEERKKFGFKNLRTIYGSTALEMRENVLKLSWEKPIPAGTTLVLPDYFENPVRKLSEPVTQLEWNLVKIMNSGD